VLPVRYELDCISQLTVSRLSRQCGIFNISQPYRPPLPYGDTIGEDSVIAPASYLIIGP
jgi:hypothetical protein